MTEDLESQSQILIVTHDGAFHGDDVLSVAILSTIFKNHRVIRTRDQTLIDMADFVVDVGGLYDHDLRRYDHHMPDPPKDKYEHILSSAGLVWRHHAQAYLRAIGIPHLYTYRHKPIDLRARVESIIKTRWIVPIDRNDNGVSDGPTAISELVAAMAPIDAEKSRTRFNALFLEAVSMVSKLFERACFHAADHAISRQNFSESEKEYLLDGKIMISSTEVRNFGNFINTDIHFVIFPATDHVEGGEYYIIRPIYEVDKSVYKTPFPSNALALSRDNLIDLGYPGIGFVHHSGFMARADTKEDAIRFCTWCFHIH